MRTLVSTDTIDYHCILFYDCVFLISECLKCRPILKWESSGGGGGKKIDVTLFSFSVSHLHIISVSFW